MASVYVKIGIGLLVALIFVIMYYANKTSTDPNSCIESLVCPDTWKNSDGTTIHGVMKQCIGGAYVTPGYGPGLCTNPCSPNQTPCWDSKNNQGVCRAGAGTACPCASDSDCGGTTQGTCNADGSCSCKPGWSGPTCSVKGGMPCDASGKCGSNGTCVTAGSPPTSYCVCKPGWADNIASGVPCSTCAPGWGPPIGSPDYAPENYCKGVFYSGVTLPLPFGLPTNPPRQGYTVECGSNANLTSKCQDFFGPTSTATGEVNGNVCSSCSPEGDYVPGCAIPKGFWASPNFDAVNYNPWAFSGCKMALPEGFVMPLPDY